MSVDLWGKVERVSLVLEPYEKTLDGVVMGKFGARTL